MDERQKLQHDLDRYYRTLRYFASDAQAIVAIGELISEIRDRLAELETKESEEG